MLRDADGKTLAEVPLDSPEAMNVALARLVQLGFRNSVPASLASMRSRLTL